MPTDRALANIAANTLGIPLLAIALAEGIPLWDSLILVTHLAAAWAALALALVHTFASSQVP